MPGNHAERYRQIAETLTRHGLGFLVGAAGLQRWLPFHHGLMGHERREEPYSNPEHLRLALEQLGPTFVKLGQVLSTRADLLPEPYRRELARLQDAAPAVPGPVITDIVERELGAPPSAIFTSFGLQPLASASLGQAHAAVLADGTEVVVKVRRPDVVEQVEQDLEILRNMATRASHRWEAAADYDVIGIAEEFANTLRAELDYLHEGRSAERFATNFAGDENVHIPRIYWDTTTSRVLTLERIRGIKVSDLQALDAAGIDRPALAVRAARAVAKMIFEDGFFHADPHPGNLFIELDGRIGLIDFGMVGEIDQQLREKLGTLLIALARQNPRRVASTLADVSSVRGAIDLSALTTDLTPIIEPYEKEALGEIPVGTLIQDTLTVIRHYHLQLPRQLALLVKMLAMTEGLGVQLDPQFRLAQVITPYAKRLISQRYTPAAVAHRLTQAGADALDAVEELPDQLRRLQSVLDSGGPELHLKAAELDPVVDRLEATGQRLVVAIVTAAAVRTIGELAAARSDRRQTCSNPLLRAGQGAVGALGAYLLWTGRPPRKHRR
ncbi:ABC-1 domain-containing protein [uncultured Mycobacterium sp.]|uniref:ABC transporter n=2 Tax=Mycobacteriaceae TaxID=1762 RepID=A0A064C917_9MYCO|nr:AarF/ABC1/UbiB kinase family protein [Mycolicibacterium aromaticivorans]KDE97144.1 ABC transporter [Mycolicibacterium aromaticivorans JS19b1 = JCM 16368]SBS77535.1 ABC-1 domain-containing protein [uncultured Mycobacterium sp.]